MLSSGFAAARERVGCWHVKQRVRDAYSMQKNLCENLQRRRHVRITRRHKKGKSRTSMTLESLESGSPLPAPMCLVDHHAALSRCSSCRARRARSPATAARRAARGSPPPTAAAQKGDACHHIIRAERANVECTGWDGVGMGGGCNHLEGPQVVDGADVVLVALDDGRGEARAYAVQLVDLERDDRRGHAADDADSLELRLLDGQTQRNR